MEIMCVVMMIKFYVCRLSILHPPFLNEHLRFLVDGHRVSTQQQSDSLTCILFSGPDAGQLPRLCTADDNVYPSQSCIYVRICISICIYLYKIPKASLKLQALCEGRS